MATFYAENYKIKKVLEDILMQAYSSNKLLPKYKSFYLMISDKNVKSFAGRYSPQSHTIEIVGLNRDSKHIVITCIHELSHHVDYINRGKSDHSSEFYNIYKTLLYAALNMRVFTPDDVNMSDVTDSNKVKAIVNEWKPSFVDYKKDMVIIKVSNCFEQKEYLKQRGYKYNAVGHTWDMELQTDETDDEKVFLHAIGITDDKMEITNAADFNIKVKLKIYATGDTYDHKEYLKENKFRWKDKAWVRYVEEGENAKELMREYQLHMPNCRFTYKT